MKKVLAFDLQRFLGSWYEVARYDHWFERGMEETKATYKLREDGKIDVLNTGIKNGKPKTTASCSSMPTTSMPSSAATATSTSGSSRANHC